MSKIGEMFYAFYAIQRFSMPKKIAEIFDSEKIKQLPADEYLRKIEEMPNAQVIDLRTPIEYKLSHHPKAININYLFNFKEKIQQLDSSRPIFITCLTAHRSPYAAYLLKQMGFKEIYDLKGGFVTIRNKIPKK